VTIVLRAAFAAHHHRLRVAGIVHIPAGVDHRKPKQPEGKRRAERIAALPEQRDPENDRKEMLADSAAE